MSRRARGIVPILCATVLCVACSSTPTRKFAERKATPEETREFEAEKGLLDRKAYGEAEDAFQAFIDRHPESELSEHAAFAITEILFAQEEYKDTFNRYKQFLKDYPISEHLPVIEENLYTMGMAYIEGRKKGFLGIFGGEGIGIDILEKLIETFPRGRRGVDATRVLGNYYYDRADWPEAIAEYEELRKNYPESEWKSLADYRIAAAYFNQIRGADYDRSIIDKAREEYSSYIRLHPEGNQIAVAKEKLRTTREMLAEKDYRIAKFYVFNDKPDAAVRYFQACVDDLPDSVWADKSKVELHRLKGEQKGES
jgi:outer membrane protein assembly factor BamD (BamD/ComL family)